MFTVFCEETSTVLLFTYNRYHQRSAGVWIFIKNLFFGVWATHPVVPSKSGTSSGGLHHRVLNQDSLKINSLEIIKSNLYTVTPFLEFPFQVIQMQTETQQNLQKEMQKMHQKFKAREDKSKKEHREEMGQVIQDWAWLPSFAFDMGFLCCISN